MVTVNLSYYNHRSGGVEEVWFKLTSDGGYTWDSRLRNGDEDLRVIDLFLTFTKPSRVELNFPGSEMDNSEKLRLERRVSQYFSKVV
jgi:hypothetical protein